VKPIPAMLITAPETGYRQVELREDQRRVTNVHFGLRVRPMPRPFQPVGASERPPSVPSMPLERQNQLPVQESLPRPAGSAAAEANAAPAEAGSTD
jgi:hypothetical protein